MNKFIKPMSASSAFKTLDESLVENPMYHSNENVLTQAVTYEEIGTTGFSSRGGHVTAKNVITPRRFSHLETLQLEDVYRLHPHEDNRNGFFCNCYLVVCLTAGLTLVVSIAVLVMVFLIIFQAVLFPDSASFPTTCSCLDTCNCTCYQCENDLILFKQLSQQLTDIQSEFEMLSVQGQTNAKEAIQRVKEFLLQAEDINKIVEQISGLTVPAQISINMSTGCKQTTVSEEINLYSSESNSFKYFDETHVIVDITCELELDGKPSRDGVGVVVSKTTSNSSNAFQHLSEVELQCICYYWNPDQKQMNTGAYCRRVITQCPYKKQPYVDTVIIT